MEKNNSIAKSIDHLAVLGAGKMGGILIEAFLKRGLTASQRILATVAHPRSGQHGSMKASVSLGMDNRDAARRSSVILLCVKPQTVGKVLKFSQK